MRFAVLIAMSCLAACASISNVPTLEDRLASWSGAPAQKLLLELGDPSKKTDGFWEWRIAQRSSASSGSSSLGRSTGVRCTQCDANSASSGYNVTPMSGSSGSIDSGHGRNVCVYRATVDGDTIARLDAKRLAGRCRFDEIGFRSLD